MYDKSTNTSSISGLPVSEAARNEWISVLKPGIRNRAKTSYDDGRINVNMTLTFGKNPYGDSPGAGDMNTGEAFIDLSYFDKNSNLKWENNLPSDAKRTANLGRVMEHEFLGHAKRGWDDYNVSSIGGAESRTTISLVNSFRVGMGLENYQRMFYRLEDRGISFYSDPDDNLAPLYFIGKW